MEEGGSRSGEDARAEQEEIKSRNPIVSIFRTLLPLHSGKGL
jgi:hypothetical protein